MNSMLIAENSITQHPNDKQEIKPALENLVVLPDKISTIESLVAD